jgi:hypothetical protein
MKRGLVVFVSCYSLLVLVILSTFIQNTDHISEAILAITGIIIVWYTHETSQMKEEMASQRRLSASPFVIIEEEDRKFILKNYGTPALNLEISGVDLDKYDSFVYPKITFLGSNHQIELIGKCKSGISLIDQSLHVYWNGLFGSDFEINVSIRYNDLTGRRYETLMKVGKGDHKILHIKEIKEAA